MPETTSEQFVCESCGSPVAATDPVCSNCGRAFRSAKCAACGAVVSAASRTCPACGQTFDEPAHENEASNASSTSAEGALVVAVAQTVKAVPREDDSIVLRPGEQIWHAEEPESEPEPGTRRPLLVIDERYTHVVGATEVIMPGELVDRVRGLVARDNVPVDVDLVTARWLSDTEEARPRLLASIRGHRYSDIKAILGVDYMGSWASVQLHLAMEPEPLPSPPVPPSLPTIAQPSVPDAPSDQSFKLTSKVTGPLIAGVVLIAISIATHSMALGVTSVVVLAIGFAGWVSGFNDWERVTSERKQAWFMEKERMLGEWREAQAKARRVWEEQVGRQHEEYQRAQAANLKKRAAERLARTFKVDDLRLFSTAMNRIFDAVVAAVSEAGHVVRSHAGMADSSGPMKPPDRYTNQPSDQQITWLSYR